MSCCSLAQCLRVVNIEATNQDLHSLMAMGLCNGRKIDLVQPGDPMIIRVCGTRIGLAARLADQILVQTCEGHACSLFIT